MARENVGNLRFYFFAFSLHLQPFFARLQSLLFCLRNFKALWQGIEVKFSDGESDIEFAPGVSGAFSIIQSVLQSAPMFILQLYVMNVQHEPVTIIQMIPLTLSFVNYTSTIICCNHALKHSVLLFITHFFLMSSRLFAIVYFAVSYQYWIFIVLLFHATVLVLMNYFMFNHQKPCHVIGMFFLSAFLWLRDDFTFALGFFFRKDPIRLMQISAVLFVIENIAMMLSFFTNTSLPGALTITICVCSSTVLGFILRITNFSFLTKGTFDDAVPANPATENNNDSLSTASKPPFWI